MKLPDFRRDPALMALKRRMGLSPETFGRPGAAPALPSPAEEQAIRSGEGVDVTDHDVTIRQDRTFAYRGLRVVIHIRDVADYGTGLREPRFHVVQCATIREMRASGRFERYVVNAEPTGLFRVNVIRRNVAHPQRRRLKPCQNCLAETGFAGFSLALSEPERRRLVETLTPADLLAPGVGTIGPNLPAYDIDSAPENVYPPGFSRLARRLKAQRNHTCEACAARLAAPHERRFLHVHHRNGLKCDNRPANLQVLCHDCHAAQPGHGHMNRIR